MFLVFFRSKLIFFQLETATSNATTEQVLNHDNADDDNDDDDNDDDDNDDDDNGDNDDDDDDDGDEDDDDDNTTYDLTSNRRSAISQRSLYPWTQHDQ